MLSHSTYALIRPLLFRLDAERAHHLALAALKYVPSRLLGGAALPAHGPLAIRVAGIDFPGPVGQAAGLDKDARVPDALLALGFGFAEVGSITPLPQPGNPKPRLFRLVEDAGVINRMGFNNGGAAAAAARLAARAHRHRGGIVGVNLGANKDASDRIADYAHGARVFAPLASYLVVNVSSPNTPGLRALQDPASLEALLAGVIAARDETGARPPVFLKVAPDLLPADIDAIARIAIEQRLGGLIVSNTTITRPALRSAHAGESGGLSGAPLKDMALERLRDFRKATGSAVPLVGVGGIASAEDAWARICAGASLVQLYSAMVYEGPGIAHTITRGLEARLAASGFATLAEAVGSEG